MKVSVIQIAVVANELDAFVVAFVEIYLQQYVKQCVAMIGHS